MTIYDWSINEALNANSDFDVSWKTGQLAGATNGSMRKMMQRFMEYMKDLVPQQSSELSSHNGYKIKTTSKIKKPCTGLRFYMLPHRNSLEGDRFSVSNVSSLVIYLYDLKKNTYEQIKKDQLIKGGCYEMLFYEYLPGITTEKKGVWVVANFYYEQQISTCPIGSIVAYGADKILPKGWTWCTGTAIEKEKYKDLYKAIGDKWGHCEEPDKFILPDFRGIFLRGLDPTNKFGDFKEIGVFQDSCNKTHSHKASLDLAKEHTHEFLEQLPDPNIANARYPIYYQDEQAIYKDNGVNGPIKNSLTHNHEINLKASPDEKDMRPVNYAISYIIKTSE